MIPFTITDAAKRKLGAYLLRIGPNNVAEAYDPASESWSVLTTFDASRVIPVTQLATSTQYVGAFATRAIEPNKTQFLLACPAGGGEPIGTPAFIDATPELAPGQTIVITIGRPC